MDDQKLAYLCYVPEDKDRVMAFKKLLAEREISSWIDIEDLQIGDSVFSERSLALGRAQSVIVFVSKAFVTSKYPRFELRIAQREQLHSNKRILPVVLDELEPSEIPPEISGLVWLDLSNFTHHQRIESAVDLLSRAIESTVVEEQQDNGCFLDPLHVKILGLSESLDDSFGKPSLAPSMLAKILDVNLDFVEEAWNELLRAKYFAPISENHLNEKNRTVKALHLGFCREKGLLKAFLDQLLPAVNLDSSDVSYLDIDRDDARFLHEALAFLSVDIIASRLGMSKKAYSVRLGKLIAQGEVPSYFTDTERRLVFFPQISALAAITNELPQWARDLIVTESHVDPKDVDDFFDRWVCVIGRLVDPVLNQIKGQLIGSLVKSGDIEVAESRGRKDITLTERGIDRAKQADLEESISDLNLRFPSEEDDSFSLEKYLLRMNYKRILLSEDFKLEKND